MSLLMDALKKAELAKRQAQGEGASSPEELGNSLELAPLDAPSVSPAVSQDTATPSAVTLEFDDGQALPNLPSHLEVLDDQFLSGAPITPVNDVAPPVSGIKTQREPASPSVPPATTKAPSAAETAAAAAQRIVDREAAQNLFSAKQPDSSRKNFALAIALFGLLGAGSIGIYFWLQLQPKGGLGNPASHNTALRTPPPQPPALAVSPPTTTPLPPVAESNPPAPMPGSSTETAVKVADDKSTSDAAEPPKQQIKTPPAAPPVNAVDVPIRITSSIAKPRLDPGIEQGYAALQSGNLASAKSAYERSLKSDPRNLDALHGLAAIQLQQGQPDKAEAYYLQALEADPKDSIAQAGLIALHGQGNPLQAESRLKGLVASQPDAHYLHFSLGNLLARQNRWAEAQQAYFQAMAGDSDNPDYLFNLAISLDHLHQEKLAAQYYEKSLAAANKRSAGFDKAQVADRLKNLQQP